MCADKNLKYQIACSAGSVVYTYTTHWKIVERLKNKYNNFKNLQLITMAITTTSLVTYLKYECIF